MAELGSHQLDAASIFIAAAHGGEKQHPLSVAAAADRPLFPADRDVEDHVYCIFEFPAPGYDPKDPIAEPQEDRRAVRLDQRQRLRRLRRDGVRHRGHAAAGDREGGRCSTRPTTPRARRRLWRPRASRQEGRSRRLQVDEAGDPESAAIGTLGTLPAERGYTEELEHWAWCIRNRAPENLPHCHPKVALGDAVIALTANMAARQGRADRVQEGVVRHRQRRDAGRRQAGYHTV